MKRYKRIAIAGVCVLGVIAGLRLLATILPVKLEGPEWNSIDKCATNQKWLYQSIEWYVRENGKLPQDLHQHPSQKMPPAQLLRLEALERHQVALALKAEAP